MSRSSAGSWGSRLLAGVGILALSLAVPAAAQNGVPAKRDSWSNESQKPALPPAAAEQNRTPQQPAAEPPSRRDEEVDAPPTGCRYRGNKLELLV
jgi:hypothetical protein